MKKLIILGVVIFLLYGCAQTRWVNRYSDANNERQLQRDYNECEYQANMVANTSGMRTSIGWAINAAIQQMNCMQARGWYTERVQ